LILIGIGGNLPNPELGPPRATCGAAIAAMAAKGLELRARSSWFESPPWPPSDQPWYVNGVLHIETTRTPTALLDLLLGVEADFGRRRGERNAPRTLDLDILAMDDTVTAAGASPTIPHPRLHERAFVLLPLAEVAPGWIHPGLGQSVEALIAALPDNQRARRLADGEGRFGTEWRGP